MFRDSHAVASKRIPVLYDTTAVLSVCTEPVCGMCRDTQAHTTTSPSGSRRAQGSSPSSQEASMQLGAIVGCMACLLQRLAYGESLSAESRGGGRESNARLVPYLFQLGHYFAGFCSESDLQVSCVSTLWCGFHSCRCGIGHCLALICMLPMLALSVVTPSCACSCCRIRLCLWVYLCSS